MADELYPDFPRAFPQIGSLPAGARGTICDVPDVTVGHCTLARGALQTGVTVIRPQAGDLYREPLPAGLCVINGFGKSVGLLQVQELGELETPIALTNTFSVSAVAEAQIRAAIAANPEIGRSLPTVNPLVFECNDGYLNDIQAMAVSGAHYDEALAQAQSAMRQGAVGAGRGMSCFGLKGGIGSASRRVNVQDAAYTLGALVLANFGRLANLTVAGRPFGKRLLKAGFGTETPVSPERGSIILVLATDAPLDARQLSRVARRAAAGLARTGSAYGHGSGDIALAFSTARAAPPAVSAHLLAERQLDPFFEATAEACEQAIVCALWHAESVTGRDGHRRLGIREAAPDWRAWLAEPF